MAATSSNPKTHLHVRSVSLPSTSETLSLFDEQVCRLQASEASTSSSTSVGNKINGLNDLYNHVDNILLLPTTQRALAQDCQNKWATELLDGILRLLDFSSTAKDSLLMTRDAAQELQSVLRRKRGDDLEIKNAIQEYQSQRKVIKKAIHKALRDLKSCVNKGSTSIKESHEMTTIVSMLKEVESTSFTVFQSILSFILGSNLPSKSNGWNLISKMMGPKLVACPEITQEGLLSLELSLKDLEEGLECLYRHLIKTRVSVLNIVHC